MLALKLIRTGLSCSKNLNMKMCGSGDENLKNSKLESLNEKLTSHFGGKYIMNELANMFNIMLDIIAFQVVDILLIFEALQQSQTNKPEGKYRDGSLYENGFLLKIEEARSSAGIRKEEFGT
eukprot:15333469-Ditylum_brightwellii.AAC.1